MARIRSIKPDFFNDETTATLHPDAQLLLLGLSTMADRDGLLEDRPRRIKAILFPYRDVDVDAHLEALVGAGVVQRYTAAGHACIHLTTFLRDQKPHPKETSFGLPGPESAAPRPSTASRETSRQDPEASRRVPMVVGCGSGYGSGCGGGSALPVAADAGRPPGASVKVNVAQASLLPDAAATPPPKRSRHPPEKPTDARHAPLVAALCEDFKAATGAAYGFRGRDAAHVAELLKLADQDEATAGPEAPAEVRRRWRLGLAWRWGNGEAPVQTLAALVARWNECRSTATAPPAGAARRGSGPPPPSDWSTIPDLPS